MSEDLKPVASENPEVVEEQSAIVSEVTAQEPEVVESPKDEPVGEENVDLNSNQ